MRLSTEVISRLSFLVRVVQKEIELVEYAGSEAFLHGLDQTQIQNLDTNPNLALKLEAFTSRFCRLQDTVGDKLLPALLAAMQEPKAPFLDNLNKAESFGWLDSVEDWVALRQLRNQMVHEYIEDPVLFYSAITSAYNHILTLKRFGDNLIRQVEELLLQKQK